MKGCLNKLVIASLLGCFLATGQVSASFMAYTFEDFSCSLSGKFRPENIWAKNANWLNNANKNDRFIYFRDTIDLTSNTGYGRKTYGDDIVAGRVTMRNRGSWGYAESIARTTCREIKIAESVLGDHDHSIPRQFMWIREIWIDLALNELLRLGLQNRHRLVIGAFPFYLGRGIALGDAYAVGPYNLGFYADELVDQYAFGGKLTGDLVTDSLSYDVYASILNNKSGSFSETAKKIQGQEYGKRFDQARGFGKINYIIAGRLVWNVFDKKCSDKMTVEPYVLFNDDREQRIQFLGDSSSRLGTVGLALEFVTKPIEFGFDCAANIGRQYIKGWDRNRIKVENREGMLIEVNTHVLTAPNGPKVVYTKGDAQKIINTSFQDETENCRKIGQVNQSFLEQGPELVELFNSCNRFRNPYSNVLKGWMFVADMGKWIYNKDLYVAVGAGFASGDDNPNEETIDGDYKGFIGLQEVYSGKRVQSAFLMSGSGRIKRPLSEPVSLDNSASGFASDTSGFTNLIYAGGALRWEPKNVSRRVMLNPNILGYWQPHPTKKFDALALDKKMRELTCNARSYLGTEYNVYVEYNPMVNVKLFFIGAVFVPGGHFTDIKGKPLNSDQVAELDSLDVTGVTTDVIPGLGDNVAVTFNGGLEYRF